MRSINMGQRAIAVALASVLLCGAATGCSVIASEIDHRAGETTGYGSIAEAVVAASPRVLAVEDLGKSLNGFAYRLDLSLVTDSGEPFSADELDAVVEAIWGAVPWEPNAIEITAGADTTDGHEVVDLRAAADDLAPLGVTNAGTGGVGLTGMTERYGEWTGPQ